MSMISLSFFYATTLDLAACPCIGGGIFALAKRALSVYH
jgi:hypothetical protein